MENAPYSPTNIGTSAEGIILSPRRSVGGYLHLKILKFGLLKSWKLRFFRLKNTSLQGFKSEDEAKVKVDIPFDVTSKVEAVGVDRIVLYNVEPSVDPSEWHGYFVPITLRAGSVEERDMWLVNIQTKLDDIAHLQARHSLAVGEAEHRSLRDIVAEPVVLERNRSLTVSELDKFNAKYALLDEIGEGSFSVVRKAVHRTTGILYAVKCTVPTTALLDEIKILKKMDHPGIVKLVDYYDCGDLCYLCMDYMQRDLCDELMEVKALSEEKAKSTIFKIIEAVAYFHDKLIVHRDVKPENVLVDGSHIKISDFGLARQLDNIDQVIESTCGTPEYAAPEVLKGIPYGLPCDIFSIGVVAYILLVGTFPFSIDSANALQQLESFTQGKDVRNMACLQMDSPNWGNVGTLAKQVLHLMLEVDPVKRATANALLIHPWFKDVQSDEHHQPEYEAKRQAAFLPYGIQHLLEKGIRIIKHGQKGNSRETKLFLHHNTLSWLPKHKFGPPKTLTRMKSMDTEAESPRSDPRRKRKMLLYDVVCLKKGHNEKSSTNFFMIGTKAHVLYLEASCEEQRNALITGLQSIISNANQDYSLEDNMLSSYSKSS